ncbi:hypothetical protein INR49_008030, partial [Caranx melampygus]
MFNYSPDVYCTKYDEGTGTCPDGDECPFLHRTAGDTERRYHLRYYKTGSCIHETDAKGHCSKNGSHCAFAHGSHDLRSPVYDIRYTREGGAGDGVSGRFGGLRGRRSSGGGGGGDGQSGQAASTALIEKILSEEPRWQDNQYVLSHYKTELCKKPPRLCRQGYACPYYHNSKDRRRSPHKHKYRALPCPSVKQSEEWGDPSKCEGAEACQYCHTRTEQQFHPEIYKSTKCNDMQQSGSCPRGPFCAFAHVDKSFVPEEPSFPTPSSPPVPRPPDPLATQEASSSPSRHNVGTGPGSVSDPFSPSAVSSVAEQGLLGSILSLCEDVSQGSGPLSPWAGEGGYGRAPGFEREDQAKQRNFAFELRNREVASAQSKQDLLVFLPVGSPLSLSSSIPSSLAATPPSPAPLGPLGSSISSGMNANALPFYPTSETVESVVESALDDLDLNDFGMSTLERRLESSSTVGVMLAKPIGELLLRAVSELFRFVDPDWLPWHPSHPAALRPLCRYWEAQTELEEAHRALKQWGHSWRHTAQSWAAAKAEAEESRALAARLTMDVERARHAEEKAQRQATLLQDALESLRNGDNPHLALHQLQLLHRLPLESVLSLQAQLCSCLHAVEQCHYPVVMDYSVRTAPALQSAPSVLNRPSSSSCLDLKSSGTATDHRPSIFPPSTNSWNGFKSQKGLSLKVVCAQGVVVHDGDHQAGPWSLALVQGDQT